MQQNQSLTIFLPEAKTGRLNIVIITVQLYSKYKEKKFSEDIT